MNWPSDVERSPDIQKFSFVIENVEFVRVEIESCTRISNKSVVGPTVPQARHYIEELAGTTVANRVVNVLLKAEIHCLVWVR